MSRIRTIAIVCAAAVTLMGSSAFAALVPVPNADFEVDAATRIGQQNGAPPSWSSVGVFGTMRPSDLGYYDETNVNFVANNHGQLVAFAQGGATLSQTLATTYAANTTYTLSVLVGDSYEGVSGDYEIRLIADGNVMASFGGPYPASAFTSEWAVASFSTGAAGGAVGQAITIEIFAETGATKTFDNVTLDATAIPEPASLALIGLGGLLLTHRRRG